MMNNYRPHFINPITNSFRIKFPSDSIIKILHIQRAF
jgi:hypothetical protein